MANIFAKTKDPFAVPMVCDWADEEELLYVSGPDADDYVTVALYGMERTHKDFAEFAALVRDWQPVDPSTFNLSRIIAENKGTVWHSYFEDLPGVYFTAETPPAAVQLLIDDFGISVNNLEADDGTPTRLGYNVKARVTVCPDCRGSGKYHGFSLIDDCKRCGGRGKV